MEHLNDLVLLGDPRLTLTEQSISEIYKAGKGLEEMTQTAANALKQLAESKACVYPGIFLGKSIFV